MITLDVLWLWLRIAIHLGAGSAALPGLEGVDASARAVSRSADAQVLRQTPSNAMTLNLS